jgi:hypothetical protein
MGRPKRFQDSAGFYCPYRITGSGDENIRYAGGVESMQAVQLALYIIAADLSGTVGDSHTLTWEAGEYDGDMGFRRVQS